MRIVGVHAPDNPRRYSLSSILATLPRSSALRRGPVMLAAWLVLISLFSLSAFSPPSAYAAPSLILPTVPGEEWKIIQGYACGTHNAWDRYSLDIASAGGELVSIALIATRLGQAEPWWCPCTMRSGERSSAF